MDEHQRFSTIRSQIVLGESLKTYVHHFSPMLRIFLKNVYKIIGRPSILSGEYLQSMVTIQTT